MKIYEITLKDSNLSEVPLVAMHNREALKLAGSFIKNTMLKIAKIVDDKGKVIYNDEQKRIVRKEYCGNYQR